MIGASLTQEIESPLPLDLLTKKLNNQPITEINKQSKRTILRSKVLELSDKIASAFSNEYRKPISLSEWRAGMRQLQLGQKINQKSA